MSVIVGPLKKRIRYGEDLEATLYMGIASCLTDVSTSAPIIGKIEVVAKIFPAIPILYKKVEI